MRPKLRVVLVTLVMSLFVLAGCGRRARATETETASTEGGEASAPSAPETPEAAEARYREYARLTGRMPVWDSPLRSLSAEGLEVLRRHNANRGNREEVLSLEVVSPDWEINRHRATGIILYRWVHALVITREADGRCLQRGAGLMQEYIGNAFSDVLTTQGSGPAVVSLPCEVVDAIAAARPDVAR